MRIQIMTMPEKMNLGSAPEIGKKLKALIEQDAEAVIVDLAQTEFIDSACIAELIGAHRTMQDRGGVFAVAGARDVVADILHMTRIDNVLKMYVDVESARADLEA